jgi:hypothetical protein
MNNNKNNNSRCEIAANDIVRQRIKTIAGSMGLRYLFASMYEANLVVGDGDFPVVIDVLPTSGNVYVTQGLMKDAPNCLLFFCDKTSLDYNAEREQPVIVRMKQLAFEFIAQANKSGYFEEITDASYQIMYDRTDVSVSGVALSLTLRDAIGVCV